MGRIGNSLSDIDYFAGYAERFIVGNYGRNVSIEQKLKFLDKFGYNPSLDTTDGAVTVSTLGTNETLQTTNSITHVTAGTGDTQTLFVEGHYLDANGNLIFKVQTVTLSQTTNVALTQPLARVSRAYIKEGSTLVGPVDARIGSGGTSVAEIPAGENQTQKCQTSLSYRDFYVVYNFGSAVLTSNNGSVTFEFEFRPLFDTDGTAFTNPVWRPLTKRWVLGNNASETFPQRTPIILPPNSDVRITATTTANSTIVTGFFDGYLAVDKNLADRADPAPA